MYTFPPVGATTKSTRSSDHAQGPEWDSLVAMTPAVLPYAVAKLKRKDEIFAVHLCQSQAILHYKSILLTLFSSTDNSLQTDPAKVVDQKDSFVNYDLDRFAKKIRQTYTSQTIKPFLSNISMWAANKAAFADSTLRSDYFDDDSYRALVAMGSDQITSLVMAIYARDQSGCWYELLNELVYGRRSGSLVIDKQEEYAKWKKWFEESGSRLATRHGRRIDIVQ